MFPLSLPLAVALLTTPSAAVPDCQPLAHLRPLVQRLALAWEVLGPGETRYLLADAYAWPADLRWARQRYQESRDAPALGDALRLPTLDLINECLVFNRGYRRYLEERYRLMPLERWDIAEALRETDDLYRLWDTVRDARCAASAPFSRRQALERLRNTIGPHAYYAGQLPPAVPVWRLPRLD